jgi:hypothetical protein
MNKIQFILALLLGAFLAPSAALAAEGASVRAILIRATNEKGPSDPRLKPYEAELQRNLVFSSFRFVNEVPSSVAAGGKATLQLGGGHRLELENEKDGLRAKMLWRNGTTQSLNVPRDSVRVFVNRVGDDADAVLIIAK